MKILVFADSHGHTKNIINVLQCHTDIEYVIHLGDYGKDVRDIEEFNPSLLVEAVQGNNDRDYQQSYPLEKVIRVAGKRIFIAHGHTYGVGNGLTPILAKGYREKADAVLFGHTHVPMVKRIDNILVINPGSIYRQRIMSGPTYAVLEIIKDTIDAKVCTVK